MIGILIAIIVFILILVTYALFKALFVLPLIVTTYLFLKTYIKNDNFYLKDKEISRKMSYVIILFIYLIINFITYFLLVDNVNINWFWYIQYALYVLITIFLLKSIFEKEHSRYKEFKKYNIKLNTLLLMILVSFHFLIKGINL